MKWAMTIVLMMSLLTTQLLAEASIPSEYRVPNEAPGWCFWVCVDTMARRQQVKPLIGILASRKNDQDLHIGNAIIPKNGGCGPAARDKFSSLGFTRYKMREKADVDFIKRATDSGRGVLVHIHVEGAGCHAVILTHIDDSIIKYVDLNPGVIRHEYLWDTRESFDRAFQGFALYLE